ncbi:MAG: GIY-YIG nuclease family protein [Deltaproteobacteria bacterium]|nr:GIY-YIG nuclease family protein [Candidatus Anaeroferrophillus wilburensis]MBN2888712.1 GIY-YIG nuclease family protein [Deltaproteobacteria bacterium]
MKLWVIYILRCNDGTLYTGITNNLDKRIETHARGQGSRYTRARLPLELVYQERASNRSEATRREIALKRMTRSQKIKLLTITQTGRTHAQNNPMY